MPEKYKESEQLSESLSDLNLLAMSEFKQLVEENMELKPNWKKATIQLLEHGIPKNLDALEKLVTGDSNAETQAT